MIAYFDTSALVPLIIDEPISDAATRLWDAADRIVNSRPAFAEARAALARARRMGRLGRDSCQTAVRRLETLVDEIDVVEVTEPLVRRAGVLSEQSELRGYDALHLASAELVRDHDLVMVTGDRDLLSAAADLGLAVADLHGWSDAAGPDALARPIGVVGPRPMACGGIRLNRQVVTRSPWSPWIQAALYASIVSRVPISRGVDPG